MLLSKNQDPDNAAVLDLHSTTALEGCLILVCAQAKRVPKSDRILNAKFLRRVEASIASGVSSEEVSGNSRFPASTQRGGSVQAPIAPGRTGQSILEEHPDDRLSWNFTMLRGRKLYHRSRMESFHSPSNKGLDLPNRNI